VALETCRRRRPFRWSAAPAALLVAVASAAQTAVQFTLDPLEMRRLLYDLEADGNRLVEDARDFLKRSWRWEPVGVDRELWIAVQGLEDAADRVKGSYVHEPYPGMDRDVRAVLEQGRKVEAVFDRSGPDRDLSDGWGRVRGALRRLASSYGWDFDAGRFQAVAPPPRDETGAPLPGPGEPWDADPYRDRIGDPWPRRDAVPPRYTRGDDLVVRNALTETDRQVRALRSQLRYRPIERTEDIFQGLAEGLLRGARRNAGIQTPGDAESARLDADLAALETAAGDALRQFGLTPRAAEVRPEARSLLRLGRTVYDDLKRSPRRSEVANVWTALRDRLNDLAAIYDLEPIPAE
jgi:hypothetical protein